MPSAATLVDPVELGRQLHEIEELASRRYPETLPSRLPAKSEALQLAVHRGLTPDSCDADVAA